MEKKHISISYINQFGITCTMFTLIFDYNYSTRKYYNASERIRSSPNLKFYEDFPTWTSVNEVIFGRFYERMDKR